MPDPFQSQTPKKVVRSAKTVQVVKPGQEAVVSGESLNAIALQFIRAWKQSRSKE